MEWLKLKTEDEINELLNLYDYFEDSYLVKFVFESGNFVDLERVAHGCDKNNLMVRFERIGDNPFAIELLFERTRRINCIFPFCGKDNWTSDIMYAKIVHNEEFYYWTTWENFDPYNQEHLNYNDFMMIESYGIKWRSAT